MTFISRMWRRLEGEPPRFLYHVLLAALVTLFVFGALGEALRIPHWVLKGASVLLLVLSILVVGRTRVHFRVALGLLVPAVFLRVISGDDPGTPGAVAGLVLGTVLLGFVAGTLASRIFGDRTVTWESISGAICVYMLMGFAWSMTYLTCWGLRPNDAFTGVAPGGDLDVVQQQLSYFSFVTLTTLGYGDVTPTHPITRMLATLEAIVGQLFLVIMVARLVAMQVAARAPENRAS